ncbi:type II secretory pathway, component HofQ, partial [Mesotoga sp. SC_3PWM13N19]
TIEEETARLEEIQDPHFMVQRALPPLDQLELLIDALGIKVGIIPVEDKYLIVGNRDSVDRTGKLIDQLIDAIYPEGEPEEQALETKTFIFLPVRPEDIAPLEIVMEKLGVVSEFIQISTGVIAVGSGEELLKALDIVESVMAHSESVSAELSLRFRFVDVRSDSIAQLLPIIERLSIDVELLNTPTGVVAIGAESELERAEELIEAINSRESQDVPLQDKYESFLLLPLSSGITVQSLEPALELLNYRVFAVGVADKIVAIGEEEDLLKFRSLYKQLQAQEIEREERVSLDIKAIPGWDLARVSEYLRLFLGVDDFERISIMTSSSGFVALTPIVLAEVVKAEISRLREFEDPAFAVFDRIPPVDDLEGLLARLGVMVDLAKMGSSTIVIGSGEDVRRTSQIMEQLLKSVSQDVTVPEAVEYRVVDISGEDIGSFNAILERLAIEVSLITSPSGVIAIGSQEAVERTIMVVDDILSRRTTAQVYEPTYAFTGIQSSEIDSYQAILDKLGAGVELLPSATGVLMIGDREKVETAIKTVNAILEREALVAETEGEKGRVSNVAAVVPGWNDAKYASYFMDFLGEDDFSRISITPSSSGYIVVGPLEVISRLVAEADRLAGIEDPFFVIETSLPAIDQLDTLLERLGLKVTILPVGDKHLVVGMKESVEKTVELIKMLRNGLEAPLTSRKYDYIIMPASEGTFETIRQVLSELKIDATALSFGSNVIIVGYGEDLESAAAVVVSINEKTATLKTDEELMYSFTEIPNDRIEEFRAILEGLAIDIELLSSPSGVIVIGSQQAVSRTATVVEDILSRKTTPQVYEPIYAFTGIPSADIGSYQTILDKLNSGVELLPSATGVLMIGDRDKVQEAVKTVNAILEREALFDESEGQPDRVSNVAALVPGWNDAKYASYFTDFLGVDDFSRISITPSTSGYIVIGPEEVVSRLVTEASRLAGIEDPFFVIEDSLPAIDQLDTLLERLGLKVTILPVENKYLVVGIKESVEKTVELIKMLRSDVEAPVSSRKYEYLIMPANEGSFETIRQVLSELKIDATALSFGSNVILVGYGEDLEDAASVVNSISERTVILETDKELKYSFTEIPNDRIDEFTAILDSLKLDVELLSSPSGVVLVGTEEEAEKANEVIRSVLSKAEQDETIESRFFNNPAGWEEGKLVAYLRGFLGEKDWAKVSATPVQSGYLLVGPSEILNRIHSETVRLAGLEKPYYEIVETVPSIQNLQAMLEKMGLAVTVVTVDGRSMVIGPESDVLQTVKVFGELAEGIVLPRGDEPDVFNFVEIPPEEVESFRTIFARLDIRVDLLSTPTGVIVIGQRDDISKALETITSILSRREVQVVNGEQSYMVVEVRDGFDLAAAQSVKSAFNINVYPLSVAGRLVVIGAEKEIERFVQIRNDIISEHKVTVIVPREVTIEELNGIINTLGLEISVLEIRGSFVVYGKEGEIEQVRDILNRLTSDKPSEKSQEMRIFSGIGHSTDFLNQLLSSMNSSLVVFGEGDRIVVVGNEEDIVVFESLLKEMGSAPTAESLTAQFFPKLEGWSGETLSDFFMAMSFAVKVFHESSQGYLLIGPEDQLAEIPALMDGLELKTKKLTTLYTIPSGMTFEELREILVSAGFNLSYTKLGQSMSVSGLEEDVNMAVALLDEVIRSGLGKGVSYRLAKLPAELTLEKFERILSDMDLSISAVQVDGEVMLIGPDSDLRTAKEIVEYLTPEDPAVDEKRVYSIVPLGDGLSLAEMAALVESLSLNVQILPVGRDVVSVGTQSNVDRFRELVSSVSATLGIGKFESPEYEIVELVEEISLGQFRELLSSLNIPVKIVEVANYIVFIGSGENNARAVELFSKFEKEDQEPETDEIEFATISLPEGFDLSSLEAVLDKLRFSVDLDSVGNVLLLIGTRESIENALALVERLVQVSTGDSGEKSEFEILDLEDEVSSNLLNQLFRLIGVKVEILESDTALVFVGTRTDLEIAVDVYNSLGKTVEADEGPLSYTITILPRNLTPGQLEIAFESIQIPVGIIEAGDYAIIVGTKPSLARAQELISSLRIGIDSMGTSADGSISYKTFVQPDGTQVDQFETIAGLMELKLKFEPVGDMVFMIGTGEDIAEFEEVIGGLTSEKAGIVNESRFAKRLSGIDAETLETYLLAKEILLSGVFDVSGGYLLIGTRESVDEAQAVIDYLVNNQQVHFAYIDLPASITPEILQAMVSDLLLEVSVVQITPSRYMIVGNFDDVAALKEVLVKAVTIEAKFLSYSLITVGQAFLEDLESVYFAQGSQRSGMASLEEALENIGVSVFIGRFDTRLLLVGESDHVDFARELISELNRNADSKEASEQINIEDLPPVSGWSTEQVTQFLEAAEIQLKSIIEYSGRLIGIGTQVRLENARAALNILAVDSKRESVRIEKNLVTQAQLAELIFKLGLEIEFVDLDRQWLLIGDPESLMVITRTVEEAAADREISRYITDLTVNPEELASLLRESIEGITVQTFTELQMLLIKSKSSALLDMAEKMIKEVQESRKAVDPLERGVVVEGKLVQINVANQDLEELLRLVADKLQISLLFIDDINERITMSVKDLTWEALTRVINATKPVEISRIDDIYAVTKKEQKAGEEPTDVELVYRVYHNVEEVTRLIEFYGGEVLSDPVNGYIVVRGLAKSRVDNIFDEIGSDLSRPKKQVRIETRLVDKSLVDDIQREFKTAIGINTPEILIESGSIDLDFKIIDYLDFTKLIDDIVNTAVVKIGADLSNRDTDSDLISSPSIVSMSGQEAKIHIGDTIPYLVRTIEYVDGNPVEIETIEYLNTGVELRITPTVNDDGKILLDLFIKVSEPEKYQDGTRTLYGEKTREANSRLIISNGNTLTIGGLVANKDTVTVNKMPFLSDLPFIGKLFTTENRTSDKRELVIFITAEVVEP